MLKKSIAVALSLNLLLTAAGCTTTRGVALDDYLSDPRGRIERAVLTDGTAVEFEMYKKEPAKIDGDELVGYPKYALKVRRIPLSNVQAIYYNQADPGKSIAAGIGIATAAVVVGYVLLWTYAGVELSNTTGR